jgi:hypothetical protein
VRSSPARGATAPAFNGISPKSIVDLYRFRGDVDPGARASRQLLTIGASSFARQRRARVPCVADPMCIERKRSVRGHRLPIFDQGVLMIKFISAVCACGSIALASAQSLAPSPEVSSSPAASSSTPATSADVEALRQEVRSLVGTVKTLQQQVKDQQIIIDKAHLAAESPPEKPEGTPSVASKVNEGRDGARPSPLHPRRTLMPSLFQPKIRRSWHRLQREPPLAWTKMARRWPDLFQRPITRS